MKKTFFLIIPVLMFASLLSDLKQKELNYDKNYTLEESKETEKSWINPVLLQYSYNVNNSLSPVKTTVKSFSISVNQPVFKSGAIYYSIKYASHAKRYNLTNLELKRRELVKNALEIAYDYNIAKLNEKIIKLNIQNAKIDIEKKKEAFLSGVGDSTFLNNAVLNLNTLMLSLEDLKMNLDSLKYSFANISSLNLDKLKLPKFRLIEKDKFLNKNLELINQKNYKKVKKDLYKMQLGNQLLSVNFNASYNWQDTDYSSNPIYKDDSSNYYQVGFNIVVPLSFNAMNKVKKSKIDYLKSQVLYEDKKNELVNRYKSIIRQINSLDKKILIYKKNIKIYEDLIDNTYDSITAGNATQLDLKILKNSQKTMFFNIKMLQLQKDKLLLSLYYEISGWNWGGNGKY